MDWDMMESTSHTEMSTAICTLGSAVGFRVATSLGKNGVSSSKVSSSALEGSSDIGDGASDAGMRIPDGPLALPQFISSAVGN